LHCCFCDQGYLHPILDLDLELDVQGWSHGYCLVLSFVALRSFVCYSRFSDDVSKEEQEIQEINMIN